MSLQNLTLVELADLSAHLMTLHTVGAELQEQGLDPVFDLSPGKPVTITVPFALPAAAEPQGKTVHVSEGPDTAHAITASLIRSVMTEEPRPSDNPVAISGPWNAQPEILEGVYRMPDGTIVAPPGFEAPTGEPGKMYRLGLTPSSADAPGPADAAPLDAPPVVEGPAGGAPEPAAPSRSEASAGLPQGATEGAADSGGGQDMAAPAPPAAPAPTTGTHQASFGQNAWTEEEDARLISLVVGGMVGLAMGKSAAIRAAARELGRPEQGTAFRCHHKLKGRLAAALAEAEAEATAPSPLPDPAAQPAAAPEPEPAPKPTSTWDKHAADPLTAHLMALPEKDGWTLARDLDLMELSLAGWMPNEIGIELKVRADLVKARFDLLTGLHTDEATGKQSRRWSREAVFEALQNLSRASQKGAA